MHNDPPATGIVLIGRNEGPRLLACLASLGPHGARAVYVDSGSTDGSIEAAKARGVAVVQLSTDTPFTAARARNAGFSELVRRYPEVRFIQFLDGDCRLASDWIDTAVNFLSGRSDIAIACGRRREAHPERSLYNRLCDKEWNTPIGEALACGGDCLVRREAFEAVDGYHPGLIAGEEPEMCLRLREKGWRIWRVDAEMSLHDANMLRFSQWWRRTVRAGHAFAEVAWMHRHSSRSIWKRNVLSALLWGFMLPLVIIATSAVSCPATLALALLYPIQIVRIAMRSAGGIENALFLVLGKFAETQGILRFALNRIRNKRQRLIEYK